MWPFLGRSGQNKQSHGGWLALCNAVRFAVRRRQARRFLDGGASAGLVLAGPATYMQQLEALARKHGDGRQDRRNHTAVSGFGGRDLSEAAQRARPSHGTRADPLRALQGAAGSQPAQRQARRPGQGRDPAAPRARGGRGAARGRAASARRRRGAGARAWRPAIPALAKGLVDIVRADAELRSRCSSCKGARAAYEIIVTAFAEGNRKTLKDLLSREVYDGFAGAITDRESRGEQIDQSFVGIKSADVVEAELKNGMAPGDRQVRERADLGDARQGRRGDRRRSRSGSRK